MPSSLGDLPALAPPNFAHEPFELFCVEKSKIRRPLDKMASVTSLDLKDQPSKRHYGRVQGPDQISLYECLHRPVERERQN